MTFRTRVETFLQNHFEDIILGIILVPIAVVAVSCVAANYANVG